MFQMAFLWTFLDKQPQNRVSFKPRSEKSKPPGKHRMLTIIPIFDSLWYWALLILYASLGRGDCRGSSIVNIWQVCLQQHWNPQGYVAGRALLSPLISLLSHLSSQSRSRLDSSSLSNMACGVGCNWPWNLKWMTQRNVGVLEDESWQDQQQSGCSDIQTLPWHYYGCVSSIWSPLAPVYHPDLVLMWPSHQFCRLSSLFPINSLSA